MAGKIEDVNDGKEAKGSQTRQRSTISFPYVGLDGALKLVQAVHGNVGHGECDDSQLAGWTQQSAKSSGFRVQVYAARLFGLMEGESGHHQLTKLGRDVMDPQKAKSAKAQAFLNVPLFKAVYDKYSGSVLPPAAALERDIESLGVSAKQKSRARQVMERSAEEAGFFESGKNRLVKPGVQTGGDSNKVKKDETPPPGGGGGGSGGGNGNGPDLDPIISGLLARLPKAGAKWPEKDRHVWLSLLENSFKLIYEDDDGDGGPTHMTA